MSLYGIVISSVTADGYKTFVGKARPAEPFIYAVKNGCAYSNNSIVIQYQNRVDEALAEKVSNYTISEAYGAKAALSVLKAELVGNDGKTVILTTSPMNFPDLFKGDAVRAKTNAMRQAFQLTAMIVSISLTPLVAEKLGYGMTSLVYGILGVSVILYMTFGCHENPHNLETEKPKLWDSLMSLFKNSKFWTLGLTNAFYSAALSLVLASIPFYVKYALKDERGIAVTMISAAVILMAIASFIVWVLAIKKFTLIPTWRGSLLTLGLAFIPLYFANSVLTAILAGLLLGFGLAGVMASMDLIGARIIDEDSLKTGIKREAIYSSAMGVLNRLNGLFISLAFFIAYKFFGYESGNVPGNNPGGAAKFLLIIFPFVLMILSFVMSQFLNFKNQKNPKA